MLSTDSRPRARLAAALFLVLGLSLPLSAEQSASDKLREQAKQLQADIELLNKSKAGLSAAAGKALLDPFDKEIEAKKALLAKVNEQAKQAESLEGDVQKLKALEEQCKDRASEEFRAVLRREIDKNDQRLAHIAAGLLPAMTPSGPVHQSDSAPPPEAIAAKEKTPLQPSPHAQGGKETAVPPVADSNNQKPSTPVINPVEVEPVLITGKAPKDSSVEIRASGEKVGEVVADKKGNFQLKTAKVHAGQEVRATQSNPAGIGRPVTVTEAVECESDPTRSDCRSTFEASFYTGFSIDSFAAGELNNFLNQSETNKKHERAVGGFDFAYRLAGDPYKATSQQLWVYGETVHGVRSADIQCTKGDKSPACEPFNITKAGETELTILRNATSLEAFTGFRWEFLTLHPRSESPASLYFKTQVGFLSVAGSNQNLVGDHQWAALGLMAKKGRFRESYLEAGWGRTGLFNIHPNRRLKIDGFLSWPMFTKGLKNYVRPFAQITVDTDLGKGSDSIQSFVGLDFDLCNLVWHGSGCVKEESGK